MLVYCGSCADAEQMLNAEEERIRTENNRSLLTCGCGAQRMNPAYIVNIKTKYSELKF